MENGARSYRRFLAGDDSGMVDLIKEYKDGLLLYLSSFTHSLSDAEDCVQETFIKLAIKKPKFKEKSSFKTWLYAIGRNVTRDMLRRHRVSVPMDDLAELADLHDLEQEYLIEEQKIAVHKAIRNLKQDYQQVLSLAYFEEFSNPEIALIMRKTRKQVENLLYNAKKALKAELEKEGVGYEEL
ncbi:MAG: RNA polymerase sigma factor [Oscillospiraceae bacterium]|nr:RNA polymerase sigma factor [Oscillospiraceae bacterium]